MHSKKNTLRATYLIATLLSASACSTSSTVNTADLFADKPVPVSPPEVAAVTEAPAIPEVAATTDAPALAELSSLTELSPPTDELAADLANDTIATITVSNAATNADEAKLSKPKASKFRKFTEPVETILVTSTLEDFKDSKEPINTESLQTTEALDISLAKMRAERGHAESQVALGMAYALGQGVARDPSQAKLWLELASMKGNSKAQYELGKLFYTGVGVSKDFFNAREWWLESAKRGNLDAQQKLGYLYSEGLGVTRDFETAKQWYTRAAKSGHAEAQTLLGSLYHEGNRIPQDYSEAFKWYKLAAEQGHPHAQYTLATLYHDGLGTQVDYIQCAAWVDVAVANGFEDQYDAGKNCRDQLNELSNRTASHLADTWKSRYLTKGI